MTTFIVRKHSNPDTTGEAEPYHEVYLEREGDADHATATYHLYQVGFTYEGKSEQHFVLAPGEEKAAIQATCRIMGLNTSDQIMALCTVIVIPFRIKGWGHFEF